MKAFIIELIARLKKEKPDFFKRLQKVAFYLFIIFLGITYIPEALEYLEIDYVVPAKLIVISEKLYQLFVVVFGFSFLPNKQTNEQNNT